MKSAGGIDWLIERLQFLLTGHRDCFRVNTGRDAHALNRSFPAMTTLRTYQPTACSSRLPRASRSSLPSLMALGCAKPEEAS